MINQTNANLVMLGAIFFILAFSGCKKDDGGVTYDTPNDLKAISVFSFATKDNAALSADITGTVADNVITANAPAGTDVSALVANFTTDGSKVTIADTAQISGTTANDFTSALTYTVTATDGTTHDYAVSVTLPSSTKSFSALSFTAANNSALSKDVKGYIEGTSIAANVIYGTSLTALIASFTHDGSSVKVGDTTQTSGTTANDFSAAVTYTVTAADDSTQGYSLSLTTVPNLAGTGQVTCYDGTAAITCPASGSAFYGQDPHYNATNQQSYTDNGDGTVKDNNTGLVWQKCTQGLNPTDCTGSAAAVSWADTDTYCSSLTLGAQSDWRLPTVTELSWIVENEDAAPLINATTFPNTTQHYYWASNTKAATPADAWSVSFASGNIYSNVKTTLLPGRCVRGATSPTQNFTDNGDDTITDRTTGLMWVKGESALMAWEAALTSCESSAHASKTDWRLPNKNELQSMVDYSMAAGPMINTTYFPDAGSGNHWASSTSSLTPNSAWIVNFGAGSSGYATKTSDSYVHCVR